MLYNLFVTNTPLQLLTAYIVANAFFPDANNHLLFINRNYKRFMNTSFYMKKMMTDTSTWKRVSLLDEWLKHTKVSEIRKDNERMAYEICHGTECVDQVFIGSDKEIINQLIVELSGNTAYYRIEDGVWSYACPDRSWASKLVHGFKIRVLRSIGGLHSDMVYNTGGLGYGKAAKADYLYKPNLLERYSPSVIHIDKEKVQKVMEKLIDVNDGYKELKDSVLFLGSRRVEQGKAKIDVELDLLRQIDKLCQERGLQLLYKPHPAESPDKLKQYKAVLSELKFLELSDPMEILYARFPQIQYVLAHSSSGLLFADVFSRSSVNTIALYRLYDGDDDDPVLTRLMVKSGVATPTNMQALISCLFKPVKG